MAILKNYAASVEEGKYSDPENPQWRVKVGSSYMTYYGDQPPNPNAFCEFEIAESKKGNEYIKNWRYINEDGTLPGDSGPAPVVGTIKHVGPSAAPQAAFRPVDQSLSIMTQTAFKALVGDSGAIGQDAEAVHGIARDAWRIARYWDKAIKAYMSGGDPRDAVAEQQKQEAQQAEDELNDDIPF